MRLYFPENPVVLKIELFFVFYTKPFANKLKFTENRVLNSSRRLRGVRSPYLNRILIKIYSFGKHCQIWYFEKFTFYYSSNFEPFCCFPQWYIVVFLFWSIKELTHILFECSVVSYRKNSTLKTLSFYHLLATLKFHHFIISSSATLLISSWKFHHFIIWQPNFIISSFHHGNIRSRFRCGNFIMEIWGFVS